LLLRTDITSGTEPHLNGLTASYIGGELIGVARGCSGCRCTLRANKIILGAEFMGVSCKSPRARVYPLRGEESHFYFGGAGWGVKFTRFREYFLETEKDGD